MVLTKLKQRLRNVELGKPVSITNNSIQVSDRDNHPSVQESQQDNIQETNDFGNYILVRCLLRSIICFLGGVWAN